MFMRRRLLSFLLAVGAVAGYASGFAQLARAHRAGHASGACHRASSVTPGPG